MKVDNLGIPIYTEQDVRSLIYESKLSDIDFLLVDLNESKIIEFNKLTGNSPALVPYTKPDISQEDFDKSLQSDWLMPDEYKNLDIEGFIVNECPKENYQRVIDELREFRSRNMLNLLRWLKYFVDTCRKNNVVWGVGRGSSVASYVLFLIGVHKINSVKYNLDWRDFLR